MAYDVKSGECALFRTIMENVEDVSVIPCVDSKFVQPFRIKYKQVSLILNGIITIQFIACTP